MFLFRKQLTSVFSHPRQSGVEVSYSSLAITNRFSLRLPSTGISRRGATRAFGIFITVGARKVFSRRVSGAGFSVTHFGALNNLLRPARKTAREINNAFSAEAEPCGYNLFRNMCQKFWPSRRTHATRSDCLAKLPVAVRDAQEITVRRSSRTRERLLYRNYIKHYQGEYRICFFFFLFFFNRRTTNNCCCNSSKANVYNVDRSTA